MPPDRRRKIVASLVKAVQRCEKKHLNFKVYLQTLCNDREAKQRVRDAREPEKKKAEDQAEHDRKQRVRDSRTPEEKTAEDQAANETRKRVRDSRTPEEKKAADQAENETRKRARDSRSPEEKKAADQARRQKKQKKAGPQDSFARSLVDELAQHRINGLEGSASRPRDLRLALPDSDSSDTGDESASADEDPEDESVASCDSDGDILMVKAVDKNRQLKKVIKSTSAGVPEDELLSLEKAEELDTGVSFLPLDLENSSRIEAEIKDALAYVYTDLVCISST
jgi:hypothetical protein